MEKLVTVKDVSERYGCSMPTARKYIRQMFHYESPLTAPRWAFDEWERNRERMPLNGRTEGHKRTIVPRHR